MVMASLPSVVNSAARICRSSCKNLPPGAGRRHVPPQVIIIGRPNVGKSTLWNRLVGKKLALVDDQPGVTRDRRFGEAHLLGLDFTIVDTAGWEDEDANTLPGRMRAQTEAALVGASVALFVIDSRAGLTSLDEEIGRYLHESTVPVVVIANKAEGKAGDHGVYEAFALGFGDPIPFSAEHGTGMADLFEALLPLLEGDKSEEDEFEPFPEEDEEDEEVLNKKPLKLAIVGRPNAGKSTLINALLQEDRLLTGPEARDHPQFDCDRMGMDRSRHQRSPPGSADRYGRNAQEGAGGRQAGKAGCCRCSPRG